MASAHGNGFSSSEANAFSDMLFFDTLRGFDATGVFGVNKYANVEILKKAVHALDFLKHPRYTSFRSDLIVQGLFAVGHNRAATRGNKDEDKNAHPFWVDDKIILVQNGTFRGDHKKLKDTEVDSEAIAHVLAEEPDIEKALQKVNSSYALVWFNTETKSLHLIRNHERPLFTMMTDNGALFWASEPATIQHACLRNHLKGKDKPEEIPANTLITLTIDGNKWKREDKKIDCSFRYTHTQSGPVHSFGTYEMDETDAANEQLMLGWGGGMEHLRHIPTMLKQRHDWSPSSHRARRPIPAKAEDVDNSFPELAIDMLDKYLFDAPTAIQAAERIRELNKDKDYVIDVADFLPCNARDDCTSWHVYGFLLEYEEDQVLTNVLAHWIVRGKTKQEMAEYLEEEWFTGKIRAINSRFTSKKGVPVTMFMHDVRSFMKGEIVQ